MYYKEKADVVWIYTYEGEKEAVDKKRIMKILAGTIAGIVVLAFLILDNKAEQRKVQQVAAEDEKKTQSLEYIEMEELENQDKEKQKELKAKANGNQDILITVDGIDKSLYTTVYPGVAGLEQRNIHIKRWNCTGRTSGGYIKGRI